MSHASRFVTGLFTLGISLTAAGARVDASPLHPCSLLTKADIGDRVGAPIVQAKELRNFVTDEPTGCQFETGVAARFVQLRTYTKGSFAQHTQDDARYYRTAIKPLRGIGDEAAAVSSFVWVRRHALVMSVTIGTGLNGARPGDEAITTDLARIAARRLP